MTEWQWKRYRSNENGRTEASEKKFPDRQICRAPSIFQKAHFAYSTIHPLSSVFESQFRVRYKRPLPVVGGAMNGSFLKRINGRTLALVSVVNG